MKIISELSILDRFGSPKLSVPNHSGVLVTSIKRNEALMSSDQLMVTLSSRTMLDLVPGDKVVLDGETFRMNIMPEVVKSDADFFSFTLQFESVKYDLLNVIFLLPETTLDNYLTASLSELLQVVCDNANRVYGDNIWSYRNSVTNTDVCTEQFTEMNCLAALQLMCEKYDAMFRVVEGVSGRMVINVFSNGQPTGLSLSYGHSGGLCSITRLATDSDGLMSRLYIYGSDANLPSGYPHSRLCLPVRGATINKRNQSYRDSVSAISRYGIKEGIALVDDIMPHAEYEVSRVLDVAKFKCNELALSAQYGFKLDAVWATDDYPEYLAMRGYEDNDDVQQYFDNRVVGSNKYLTLGDAEITFNTGNLSGYTFKIQNGGISADGSEIELIPIIENSGDIQFERTLPDSNAFSINRGDKFVISNIDLPYKLVEKAEMQLEAEAQRLLAEKSGVRAAYNIVFDALTALKINTNPIVCGNTIRLIDTDFQLNKDLRVERIEKDYLAGSISVEVSNFGKLVSTANRDSDNTAAIDELPSNDTLLTCRLTANYDENPNRLHISAGELIDTSLLGVKKKWTLYERTLELDRISAYSLYIKASKRTSFASLILVSSRVEETISMAEIGGLMRANIAALNSGAIDNSSVYLYIGELSKIRNVLGGQSTRTLKLRYGTSPNSASDIVGGEWRATNGQPIINAANGQMGSIVNVKVRGNQQSVTELFESILGSLETINKQLVQMDARITKLEREKSA